ncbi:MAG: NUDIX hydrolase [Candidatus Moraniibacteriota bacterium]|nr:MAG: NUDIX hydrolase [Candidatus Moranbacteria bacterium]
MSKHNEIVKKTEDLTWGLFTVSQKLILWNPQTKKFLLVKEPESDFFKKHPEYDPWVLLGGHMEGEESPEEALLREVEEEAGDIQYELLGPVFVVRSQWASRPGISVIHLGLYKTGEIELSEEHNEYIWKTPEEIWSDEKIYPVLREAFLKAQTRLIEQGYLSDVQRLTADFENYKKRVKNDRNYLKQ